MRNTKVLVEGAVVSGIYTLLFLISMYIPLFSLVSLFILPLPFIIYLYRQDLKAGLLLWAVTFGVSLAFAGLNGIIVTLFAGLTGIVMGELYRRKKPAFAVLLGASLSNIVNMLGTLAIAQVFMGINFVKELETQFQSAIGTAEDLYKSGGQDPTQIEKFKEQAELIPMMLPTYIIGGAVILAFLTHIAARMLMKRMRYDVPSFPPFREWNLPKSFLWYYIIAIVLTFSMPEKGTSLYIVTINLYMILSFVLIIQGFTVIFYYAWIKNWKRKRIILLIILLFLLNSFLPIPLEVVKFLGIIDLGFMIKKRLKPKQ
ncbi:YybS family protein [Fictibacillus sp. 5RED26]|uniref:YybS family protein n=1 Tax=Fictibacillus TaxID=1329200 RepID=UPI0018CC94F2|nr:MULTISPECIES: YybS family protein [unclassified Fictibacillus]MBH0158302.1 YybS family protein [Fictibacillus sp. 5RED26]MBH0175468.1 YybS family protein [Fictibacillus sp. 23RED33]